ncbi:MAG: hypothetical protein PF489_00020 [Salinivirgaceae bacterium]|jgi:hypothetical protein|nr:hypothetical protein [Salinivirgaceae bacterium]
MNMYSSQKKSIPKGAFKLFSLLILTTFTLNTHAQQVKDIQPQQQDNNMVVKYNIDGAKFYQTFNVDLYISRDGGKTFEGPLNAVSGDVGKGITGGEHKIVWDVFKDVNNLEGDIVFDVKAELTENEVPKEFFAMYNGNNDAFLGLMVGQVGKTGWYASFKTGTFFSSPAQEYSGDETWQPDIAQGQYYQFNDSENIRRLSVTGGFTFQAARNFFFYTGAGFGIKQLIWQMEVHDYQTETLQEEQYVNHPDYSYSGVEAEAGMMLRLGNVLLCAGASTVSFAYTNVTFGAGWVF